MSRVASHQPDEIRQLLEAGRAVAEGFLRDKGSIPAIMLAISPEGLVLHSAASTTHPEVKDDFAGACRLLARANRAEAVVLILEAWARIAPEGGQLDANIRPSTAADRIEIVSLCAEVPGLQFCAIHNIHRSAYGEFSHLGDDQGIGGANVQGRFAAILPPTFPTDIEVRVARRVLQGFGINPDGTRINPLLN